MKILLTGSSGFLGRHVMSRLKAHSLRLLVLPEDPNLSELQEHAEVAIGDIMDPESLIPALDSVTHVIHLAGLVQGGRGPAEKFMFINAQGTFNLAQAAKEAAIKHFIYTSSITVYGHASAATETSPLILTPGYPSSKIKAEESLSQLLSEERTILRLPLVIGEGDKGFMCPALQGFRQAGKVIIIGKGQSLWSVLAVSDVSDAINLCLDKPETRGNIYNVVGETITNGELLRAIGEKASCKREIRLPYGIAWGVALLSEIMGKDGLTRAQVRALSLALSMNGEPFAQLGFSSKTRWQDALEQAISWCEEEENK